MKNDVTNHPAMNHFRSALHNWIYNSDHFGFFSKLDWNKFLKISNMNFVEKIPGYISVLCLISL